ncbi:expressed protein [Phakopsora pachyrhizi]|uniref:Expressed protein n=1 Tax=Phakopsora pachyrhizi TaxID=170000 RepID=A0AAV0AP10_PHAPC|nr:expressed protein [Phakopsora pachyrhizi]
MNTSMVSCSKGPEFNMRDKRKARYCCLRILVILLIMLQFMVKSSPLPSLSFIKGSPKLVDGLKDGSGIIGTVFTRIFARIKPQQLVKSGKELEGLAPDLKAKELTKSSQLPQTKSSIFFGSLFKSRNNIHIFFLKMKDLYTKARKLLPVKSYKPITSLTSIQDMKAALKNLDKDGLKSKLKGAPKKLLKELESARNKGEAQLGISVTEIFTELNKDFKTISAEVKGQYLEVIALISDLPAKIRWK